MDAEKKYVDRIVAAGELERSEVKERKRERGCMSGVSRTLVGIDARPPQSNDDFGRGRIAFGLCVKKKQEIKKKIMVDVAMSEKKLFYFEEIRHGAVGSFVFYINLQYCSSVQVILISFLMIFWMNAVLKFL